MNEPIAVVAGDIHYSLRTMDLADTATRMAIAKANELKVPFVANGDTQDTKASLRAEYVNKMIETFKTAKIKPFINIGNHCKINARSLDHALNFLEPYANVINVPAFIDNLGAYIIPYHDDVSELRKYLKTIKKPATLIMHQGVETANMGEYVRDHSALSPRDLQGFRVILSHYHARQDIQCGDTVASFIGSPYTQTFAEADDPEKGFQILYDDGSLEFVPTSLRKHVVIEMGGTKSIPYNYTNKDLIWVKLKDTRENLAVYTKEKVAKMLNLTQPFKLDLISTDELCQVNITKNLTLSEQLDEIIGKLDATADRKQKLKELWKSL